MSVFSNYPSMHELDSRGEFIKKVISYIDDRVAKQRVGVTNQVFEGFSDADLLMELIARGYQVSLPQERVKDITE